MCNLRPLVSKWCHLGCLLSFCSWCFSLPEQSQETGMDAGEISTSYKDVPILITPAKESQHVGPRCGHRGWPKQPVENLGSLLQSTCFAEIRAGAPGGCADRSLLLCAVLWGTFPGLVVSACVSLLPKLFDTIHCWLSPATEAANSSFRFLLPLPNNHYTAARADSAAWRWMAHIIHLTFCTSSRIY